MLIKPALFVAFVSSVGFAIFFLCVKKFIADELRNRLFCVLIYCIGISFLSPNVIFHLLLSFLVVPLFAHRRQDIMPVYIFAFLTLPGISIPISAGSTYLLVLVNFMCVSAGAALIAIIKGGGNRPKGITVSSFAVFAVFAVYFFAGSRASTLTNVLRALLEQALILLLPYFVVRRSVHSATDVRRMFIAMAAACAALSTLVLYEAKTTWPMYRIIYDHYGIVLGSDSSVKLRGGLMRAPGPFPEPLSLALWLSLGTFVVLTGRWMFKGRAQHLVVCAVALVGLFAPQSRGAWLGMFSAYLFYQIASGRVAAIARGSIVLAVCGAFGYVAALNIPQLGAMFQMNSSGTVIRDYRQDLLTRGLEEARKDLLFGTDIVTVLSRLEDMRQGEGIIDFVNTYLYVLLVSGIVGLTAFAFGLIGPAVALFGRRRKLAHLDSQPILIVIALFGALTVMLAFTALVGRTTMGLSILLGLSSALAAMRIEQFGFGPLSPGRRRPPVRNAPPAAIVDEARPAHAAN